MTDVNLLMLQNKVIATSPEDRMEHWIQSEDRISTFDCRVVTARGYYCALSV
jgi:hypothetical protein